jgi:hypothetical protein
MFLLKAMSVKLQKEKYIFKKHRTTTRKTKVSLRGQHKHLTVNERTK